MSNGELWVIRTNNICRGAGDQHCPFPGLLSSLFYLKTHQWTPVIVYMSTNLFINIIFKRL